MNGRLGTLFGLGGCLLGLLASAAPASAAELSLKEALSYPFVESLSAAPVGDRFAFVRVVGGVRNIWTAEGAGEAAHQVTTYTADDGQELTQPTFSPDGRTLLYVLGGDHDANWPAEGGLQPNPARDVVEPHVAIWSAPLAGGASVKIADGDAPAISSGGRLAFLRDGQVWTAPLDGSGKAERLFFDRGRDSDLQWSPDGRRLAFVSKRGDHSFIGVYQVGSETLVYLSPSTEMDQSPRWAPDSRRLAFVRTDGEGGPPRSWLTESPRPYSLWVADVEASTARKVWSSPATLEGSFPEVVGGANLAWASGERLVFMSELDGWPHLYAVPAAGGPALKLTSGPFMVEHVALSRDGRRLIYDANTGTTAHDEDRRHVFSTPVDRADPQPVTSGEGLEWTPVPAGEGVAFIAAGPRSPPEVAVARLDGQGRRGLVARGLETAFPAEKLIVPKAVVFTAADGTVVHGQLFETADGSAKKPGLIFVHGGPPRQMLLGWSYMDYYANAYAVNQYLAAHGFVVLSVNYRLGIGYGRAFQHPARGGFRGASEYQDVLAGAKYLRAAPGVDPERIGIWGGSYGGYLTGLALARNSDLFKAGVDFHGVHDWTRQYARLLGPAPVRFETGDRAQLLETAFRASPDADVATWRSPVLLIDGDDDRNVDFLQTVDIAQRLKAQGVRFEELILPNEIHGFLLHSSWETADAAAAAFLTRELGAKP